ncbi:MAG: zinc ABC transporter substrate-binding protein [Bacteroides sp.]|nr:zinc ABC transporter substrate-binding protein [Bacteroides sp.]MCM1378685.1 zinc ABC transporter substrate-binding protein [Bacteroides sp.]MCM1444958.1 zinc ABC transporter substrate-binding protein [Prevotella sp.]
MKIKIISISIFAAVALGVCGCKNNSVSDKKPIITVSIEPQRWLLERIVGEKMEVRTLMARGGNPESYEPSFSHLADLEQSDIYMQMGNLGFESALIDRLERNFPELPIVNLSDSIDLITDDPGHGHGIDPHVWNSTTNARIIARNMLRVVARLDSKNADYYNINFSKLIHTIDSVDSICRTLLEPLEGRSFAVWHPSLSYFARDYGLNQISVGVEGKEHSVPDTRVILDNIEQQNASVFLVQQDFDTSKAAGILNNHLSIRVESINPLNYDWDSELVRTAEAIARR